MTTKLPWGVGLPLYIIMYILGCSRSGRYLMPVLLEKKDLTPLSGHNIPHPPK
jgi:hypothetical protein